MRIIEDSTRTLRISLSYFLNFTLHFVFPEHHNILHQQLLRLGILTRYLLLVKVVDLGLCHKMDYSWSVRGQQLLVGQLVPWEHPEPRMVSDVLRTHVS